MLASAYSYFREIEASLLLLRSDYDQEIRIEADLTQTGLIARLEHILEHFEADLHEQERRARDAAARLAGYEQRLDQAFALQGELDAKLAQLAALEADLAQTGKEPRGKDQTGKVDARKLAT